MNPDITLLTRDQIWGDKALDVMKKYGAAVAQTDLSALLVDWHEKYDHGLRTSEGEVACMPWTASSDGVGHVLGLYGSTDKYCLLQEKRCFSVLPVLSPKDTAKILPTVTKIINGIDIVEYGEYPQTIVDAKTSSKLEQLFKSKSLKKTGKNYTFDATYTWEEGTSFQPKVHPEVEYGGQKYIRVEKKCYNPNNGDGSPAWFNKTCWFRVEPISWMRDPSGTWVSKKCLFGGIPFFADGFYRGGLKNTFMKEYLDTYFAKEMETPEMTKAREDSVNILPNMQKKLSENSNLENVKRTITPAKTFERTDELARIMRVRRARDILSTAAQKAKKNGDKEALEKIIEIAKPYAARNEAVRNRVRLKRLERRAQGSRERE